MARVSCAAGTGSRRGGRGPWGPARGPWGLQLGPVDLVAGGPVDLVAVGPAAGTVGRGARTWCRWPCLCLYVARSRVCMSRPARTNTQGRAAGAGGRGPRRLGPGRRFAGRGAWAKARPPGGPKNGPGASCAGSSPFLHGQWCTKQFLRSSNKGPPVFVERFRLQFICIRGTIGSMKTTCSKCDGPNDRLPQRYCRACHAAYARENRPRHVDLSEEQRKRSVARAYANVYQRRGKLLPEPCAACRDPSAQKHHDDYSKPLQVTWLCRKCHLTLHLNDKTLHVEQL